MITLLGGKIITVTFEQESPDVAAVSEEIKVRQVPIRDYENGFKVFTDEVGLVSFLVGNPREFALRLTPESYEAVLETGKEVNAKGFFSFCHRRMVAEQDKENRAAIAFAQLPADARSTILSEATRLNQAASSAPFSTSQPRRA